MMPGGGINPGAGYCNWAVLVDGVCGCTRGTLSRAPARAHPAPPNSPSPCHGEGREIEGRERKRERDALYSVATDALQTAR